jgi:nitrite reductase (NADH) large subunit
MCPHKKAFVLSRGIVGDAGGVPKVACPLHKKTFSLVSGESLQQEEYRIRTFPVRVVGDDVLLELPPTEILDRELATDIGCRLATACEASGCCGNHAADAVPLVALTDALSASTREA